MSELYQNIQNRWKNCSPTIKGVLGGYDNFHDYDIEYSQWFLNILKNKGVFIGGKVLESCGGIGRVTKNLLVDYFDEVDMFDQEENFIAKAKEDMNRVYRVKDIARSSIQGYVFQKYYDAMWLQWSLENLEDEDLEVFLSKCHENLVDNGIVIVKENIPPIGKDYDIGKDYLARSPQTIRSFFFEAGFELIEEHIPTPEEWPLDILRVAIFAFKRESVATL